MIRKKCRKCGEKVNSKHRFCSNCGIPLKKASQEDWGMLGKNDFEEQDPFSNSLLDGFTGNMFNKMLGSAMKMIEKEMKKEMSRENMQPKTNVRLMINGKEVDLKNVNQPKKIEKKEKLLDDFSKKSLKRFSELPKKEPKTNVKRFSNTVIYEINIPGVKSLEDLSIVKLENSIEIKAVAKDKAYFKLIPVNLPILDYELERGKLILELEAKN
jgi:ribosomal protein L37E/HSP20 family molecular chaperone IbpA